MKVAAISATVALLVGAAGGHHVATLKWSGRWEAHKVEMSEAAHAAERQERQREQEWQTLLDKVAVDAQTQLDEVRKRERSAADNRVRSAARQYAARKDSCPAADSAPSPVGLLAELLGESDELAEHYAAEADTARVRGLACERAYDALTVGP